MKVKHIEDVEGENMADGVLIKWVISDKDGAENFYMRIIEVKPGAEGPTLHQHPYEHELYILEGQGVLIGEGGETPFHSGAAIFILPNEKHQIKHNGTLRFI